MANTPDWLIARPIAHRGLHDATAGRVENSLSAIGAAADRGFAIEVDVQLSHDGEAMVIHDGTLARLCGSPVAVDDLTVDQLKSYRLGSTADTVPTLWEALQRIGGRVPIVVEIKNDDPIRPDHHLVQRALEVIAAYSGPVAVKSFDPDVLMTVKRLAPHLPRGIVADATTDPRYYGHMGARDRFVRRHLIHAYRTQPDFVSYSIKDLPAPGPAVLRTFFNRPIITWTVRTPQDRLRASTHADQIIFEGFVP
ncbi:MAG: glycerophosphodiester phosphodiesterase family protein [Ancalomicrobiaceae bacterium]|nr:glycerophosphodiester phosphodiesterase family protein [Ancalomicrobiaceae bacterium]